MELPRLARPGETIRGQSLEIGPGGKGLNQAVAAARLGGRVHMIGCIGDDVFADVPLGALREAGIDTDHVTALDGERCGVAMIWVDAKSGENMIGTIGGANHRVSPAHVEDAVAIFRASGVLLVQLELPLEAVDRALDLAAQHRVTTVLDPAPARELDDALLRKVDVLTPNESEAQALSGIEVVDIESAARAGAELRERTQGDVIVTLGENGCVWSYATGFEHIPAPRVRAVDTTGAGDAFNGGLALGLARGENLGSALHLALRAGSAATLARGAAAAMPRPEDLNHLPG
ncbi:MAG: ribokinase [bacterium]|nr:ribokinase [bacterium]